MVDAGPYVFFNGINHSGNLYYLDKETERITFNCMEPTCGHFALDQDTCTGALWLPMGSYYPKGNSIYVISQKMPGILQMYGQYRRDFYPLGITVPKNGYYAIYRDCLVIYAANPQENSGMFSFYELETYDLKTTLTVEGTNLLYWFVYDEILYYVNMAMDLYKGPIAGGEAVLLDTKVERIAIDGENLYYRKRTNPGGLFRLGLNGGAPLLLIEGVDAFGVGTEHIYYTRYGDSAGRGFLSDKEGNNEKMFLEDLMYPYFYVFSNYDKIVVQDGQHDGIFLADLDGSNVKLIPLPVVEE
jgi:hypothetical protein